MLHLTHIYLAAATSTSSPRTTAIVLGASVVFIILIVILAIASYRQKKALVAMAAKNGWQPLSPDDNTLSNYVPDYIKRRQTGHSYSQAYKAQVNSQDVVFFRYSYQMPSYTINDEHAGDSWVSCAIVAFEVPQTFHPLLVLYHSVFDSLGRHPGMPKLTLEGDFGKHFDTYAPTGSEVEALSLLTPDLMAFLIDNARSNQSMQVGGHLVILEGSAGAISPSKIQGLLNYAATLGKMLRAKPLVNASNSSYAPAAPQGSDSVL